MENSQNSEIMSYAKYVTGGELNREEQEKYAIAWDLLFQDLVDKQHDIALQVDPKIMEKLRKQRLHLGHLNRMRSNKNNRSKKRAKMQKISRRKNR